jgi:hypothetical protein
MTEFSKDQRLAEVWKRLAAAPASASHREAFQLFNATIREVEDELTDIPYAPENWQTDGRMYPPQEDSARDVPGRVDLVRYRSRGHNTFIRTNGAIEVRDWAGNVVFAKPGFDGAGVELEAERQSER